MKYAILTASIIGFCTVVLTPSSVQAEEDAKLSIATGIDYNTGKYGGTQATDILYIPVTTKYQSKSWILKLTLPYLQITGPGSAINLINGVTIIPAPANTPITRSGLGDVVAAATHNVYDGGASGFTAKLTGKIKFGTASTDQGLGTGKNDYTLQSELYQVTGNLTSFGTVAYKVYGNPPGYTLNNGFYGSIGGSYKLKEKTNAGALITIGQATTSTGTTRMETIFFVNNKLDRNFKAQGYVLKGLTNNVPDWGIGASITYIM